MLGGKWVRGRSALGLGVIGLGQGGHRIRHTGRSAMLFHLGQLLRLKASTSMFAFMA